MSYRLLQIIAALIMGFVLGSVISFYNGQDFASSLMAGLWFSLIVGVIVSILAWAVETAKQKGYSALTGFILVLVLNILGIVILLLLPTKTSRTTRNNG